LTISTPRRTGLLAALGAAALVGGTLPATAASRPHAPPSAERQIRTAVEAQLRSLSSAQSQGGEDHEGEGTGEIADQAAQYAWERTAPALSVPPAALTAARRQTAALPATGGSWSELTDQPYQAAPAGFTDPYWSNAGSGFGIVGGRTTSLARIGTATYAGAADGGVWKSTDGGTSWTPIFQRKASNSIGALLGTGDHALWVGTGEANTNADAYSGQGVYRSTDGGRSFSRVGVGLRGFETYRLRRDYNGHVYAATTHGLFRTDSDGSGDWTRVLAPTHGSGPYDNHVTDVVVRPGTHGKTVLAAAAWRNGEAYNGFYVSTDYGKKGTFTRFTPAGDIDAADIGRTTFGYAKDGSVLYALVESPTKLLNGDDTNLQGVYKVTGGSPTGSYRLIADSAKLGASGSALQDLPGYHVGIQSWYNQALAVDPTNPNHLYVSLEEVFETRNGGGTFTTASPYWNYGLACGDACPDTTHPDQHGLLVSDGQVWIVNDGGVYRRSTSASGYGQWRNLNASMHTLQYYGVDTGRLSPGVNAYWGGLQDNGTSKLAGGDAAVNKEPAGGDGGMMIVDPDNGQHAVGEYVYLTMYLTNDGGHSFRNIPPPDSNIGAARFIAPFVKDVNNPDHWVAGGQHIWNDLASWDTVCDDTRCDWKSQHDLGDGNVATALAVNGTVKYAGWVSGTGNPGPTFLSGIDTNYGGTWHTLTAPNLPNRYVAGMAVDKADPAHVFAVYNGFSRRWIDGGGLGHVFESRDGGDHWSDISGNLPDAGGDDLVMHGGKLVVATDVGVFVSDKATPRQWSRLGANLPHSSANDLAITPGGTLIVVGTHGRGMWTIAAP